MIKCHARMVLGEAVCLHSMVKGNRCWNRDPHGNERWGPSCLQSTTCAIHREFLPSPIKNPKMCLSFVPLSYYPPGTGYGQRQTDCWSVSHARRKCDLHTILRTTDLSLPRQPVLLCCWLTRVWISHSLQGTFCSNPFRSRLKLLPELILWSWFLRL